MNPDLYEIIEATWPPAKTTVLADGWVIRDGAGGGQRVCACTLKPDVTKYDIKQAEEAMAALDQTALFMIRQGDEALDEALAARGYQRHDPVNIYHCPIETLSQLAPKRLDAFAVWPPLAIINEIWADHGIDAARQAVMRRAKVTKTAILARQNDRAAGVAYVAIQQNTAMLHALEVVAEHRRQGVAINIMGRAAQWAQNNRARSFSVICLRDNLPANRLYTSLNMQNVGYYHYRIGAT